MSSRGNRREALFVNDADRRRFLGLVAQLPERSGLEVHAFVLMDNHYHLLVRTPQPNLSHAMRWVNVSYSKPFQLGASDVRARVPRPIQGHRH